jgi:hypothetical protein
MASIKIHDLKESNTNFTVSSTDFIELQEYEQKLIVGGLDPDDGALAIIGLGIAAAAVTSVTAPAVATAAIVIGVGILFRDVL